MKKSAVITLFLFLGLFVSTSSAVEVTRFGPKQYVRTAGAPDVYNDSFSGKPGEGRLIVQNGEQDGSHKIDYAISSAYVRINGVEIFGPNDFNKNVHYLEAPVDLAESNSLSLQLQSSPDSYITVSVLQEAVPPTVSMAALPDTINFGESATLSWSSGGDAESASIDQAEVPVPVDGSTTVSPTETTTYTITVTGPGGTATDSATVTVINPPPTVSISASPETIKVGESASLTWNSTDAASVSIDHGVGEVAVTGSTTVSPAITTTYTITVAGPGGTARANATVFVQDFFTFTQNANELDYQTLTFTPDGTVSFYSACRDAATTFFTDPAGGSQLYLYFDDYEMVTLTGGAQISLYGVNYSSFYVGSNGYITFTQGDTDMSESFEDHFSVPRISGLFADLWPAIGGNISWKQLSDRVAVTFQDVLYWTNFSYNSFQIEMFFDGTIRLTYLGVGAGGGIAGLSAGGGIPDGFVESDMSAFGSCLSPLDGDFDVDGDVDEADRAVFEADFGRTDCAQGEPCEGDFDGDEDVDQADQAVFDANFGRTDGVRAVPHMVGLDQETAQSTIVSAGLSVGTITTEYSDTVPSDFVISQSPGTDTIVAPGSSVGLVISLGLAPPTVSISATPEYIVAGDSATLSWTSLRAETAIIDQGIGEVDVSGSIIVSPTVTTTYTITVTGPGGTASDGVTVNMITPPVVNITDPQDGAVFNDSTITVSGTVDGYNPTVTVNGISASVSGGTFTAVDVPLTEGDNTITAVATNQAGSGTDTISVTYVEPSAPLVYITNPLDRTTFSTPSIIVSGTVSQPDASVWVNGIPATISNGVFTAASVPLNPGANRIMATASNQLGTDTATIWGILEYQYEPQPEGSFGEQYEDLVPHDAMVASYDPQRYSLVTGFVQDLSGSPIEDVSVVLLDHPEYGTAITNLEGQFTIPVEGGATITAVYKKEGLISAHRKVYVPWNDVAIVETTTMISEDPASTTLTFDGDSNTVTTHQSTEVTDEFGDRSATMVFTGDNRAYEVDEKGQVIQELTTITTRATEFTIPESMPAKLPPNSGYTYCVELKVDGAQRIKFDKPVVTWVNNFLGFDVGEVVPVGYYDRDRGDWVPSENGVVVRLLDTDTDGIVDALDADGDDLADDLDNDGSFNDEVTGLEDAGRYLPDSTFWRFKVTHFSPWDCNWPFGLPSDAIPPNPIGVPELDGPRPEGMDCQRSTGSFVEERSRIFHEDISIPGTEMALHYTSNRSKGYLETIVVPASGEIVPASLKYIIVRVEVAGRTLEEVMGPLPNQHAVFIWDGLDHLGRPIGNQTTAHISVGFVYEAVFYSGSPRVPKAFAQEGGEVTRIGTRQEMISWKRNKVIVHIVANTNSDGLIAEGWTLSTHHSVSPSNPSTLFKGDGTRINRNVSIINTVAGNGTEGYSGDGGPATEAQFIQIRGVTVDAEGNIYIADWYTDRIRKVDTNGIISTVAGTGSWGYDGDGGPATEAHIDVASDVAVDGSGNLYIADSGNNCIRKVDRNGIITTVAGNGTQGYSGDGGPATEAQLYFPEGLAVDNLGNLYIADTSNSRIRKVDSSGIIITIAGDGSIGYGGDGGPATEAKLRGPEDVAVDAFGNLYMSDSGNNRIRKVDTSGIITTVAGNGVGGYSGDGGPATEAQIYVPYGVAVDASGNLYIADLGHRVIRKVDTSGIITTAVGRSPDQDYSGDGGPATEAELSLPYDVTVDASGNLYVADTYNFRIRKIGPPSAFTDYTVGGEIAFAEESGDGHIISSTGRHERTIDLDTGVSLYEFGYDEENNLISISDRFGNQTLIERGGNGIPTAIISPDGITTTLTIDGNNHLTRITYADTGYYNFEYSPDGLMTAKVEPEGNRFEHVFDSIGRLMAATDQEGGNWQYSRYENQSGEVLTQVTTGEGNLTSYLDYTDSTGAYTSTITDPTGAQTAFSLSADGLSSNKSLPCGMELSFHYGLDPEYRFLYPNEMIESTPLGLEKITLKDKTYQDTDLDEVPDLISETVMVNGKATTLVTDTLQATKTITSPVGRTVSTAYDPNTLLTTGLSIPALHETTYGYDVKGRLTSITTSTRQTSFTYTAQGFLESIKDPENQTTTYSYDAVGRVTGIGRPDTSSVSFIYDKNGNMAVLTNPATIHHNFVYNKVNLNSSYITPLSGSYSYAYDKDRRLTQVNFPSGKQINNLYGNGRLEQIQTPEGNIYLTYLCGSRVDRISKGLEDISYGYDGSLVTAENLTGTLNESLGYGYNSDFNFTSFNYAGGTVGYTYDNDGLLTGSGNFSINRNGGNGLPESVTGGALSLSRTFNGYGEVQAQDFTVGSQGLTSWSLTRDNAGRITTKTESAGGVTSNYVYAYDPMGRLLTVTKDGNPVEEYQYDSVGTRTYEMNTQRSIAGRIFNYDDEDHLLTAGDATYEYDTDGYLKRKTLPTETPGVDEVTNYSYSSRGELLSVTLPDGTDIEYVHDPLGRRIAKRVGGVITKKCLWQGLTRLLAVYDGADSLIMRFLYADGRMPVAMEQGGATYYLSYDQVGSLRVVGDGSGSVVKRIDYDSFGNIINDTNAAFEIPFGFAGGLHDRDTGLVRFGFRDYDPDIGRWTAKDPIGFAGGDVDLYGYVLGKPVNAIDPTGLFLQNMPGRLWKELNLPSTPNVESAGLTAGQTTAMQKTLAGISACAIGGLMLPEGAPILGGGIVLTAEGATLSFVEFGLGGDTSDIPSDATLAKEIGMGIYEALPW